jgi:hypothetical protein
MMVASMMVEVMRSVVLPKSSRYDLLGVRRLAVARIPSRPVAFPGCLRLFGITMKIDLFHDIEEANSVSLFVSRNRFADNKILKAWH